jgi:urocanate hydratase
MMKLEHCHLHALTAELEAAKAEIARYEASPTIETCRKMIENKAVQENSELYKQLAAKDAELEAAWAHNESTRRVAAKEIAARDLVIQKIQEFMFENTVIPEGVSITEAEATLSLKPNTEAIDAYVEEAVQAEREACAKVCERRHWTVDSGNHFAKAIRARGEK